MLRPPRRPRTDTILRRRTPWIWLGPFLATGIGAAMLARLRTPWLPGLEYGPWFLYLGISAALVSLLTFWFAFAPNPWGLRVSGMVAGTVSLELLSRLAEDDPELPGFATINTALSAAVFLVLHYWRPGLRLVRWPRGLPPSSSGARVSIATIMSATAVLAVMLATARLIRETAADAPYQFLLEAFCASLFVVNALVGVVAILGERSPLPGLLVVLTTAPALGCLFSYALEEDGWILSLQTVATCCLHAALILAALTAVRLSGWRLLDRRRAEIARKESLTVASTYGG